MSSEDGASVVSGNESGLANAIGNEDWLARSIARKQSIDTLPPSVTNRLSPFDPYTFPLGKKAPETIPVFIEVSAGSRNKYEWDSEHGVLILDRVLHSAVFYPENYGFVGSTLCDDGDPLDVLVMSTHPLVPGCLCYCRPLAYLVMEDEKGQDEKVLAVLANDPIYSEVKTFRDLPEHKLREISHFFETYKALEKNKWAKIGGWKGTTDTYELIENTHQNFVNKQKEIQDQL